jgi:hypothetical protein
MAAFQRTGERRFTGIAAQMAGGLRARLAATGFALEHIAGVSTAATAADYAALALAFRLLKDDPTADRLLARANERFFDPATGGYMATPVQLPTGIAVRVPASGDMPSAETLALLAGVDAQTAGRLRRGLLAAIEYDELPAGDTLFALSRRP